MAQIGLLAAFFGRSLTAVTAAGSAGAERNPPRSAVSLRQAHPGDGSAGRNDTTISAASPAEVVLRWVIAHAETDLHPPAAYCVGRVREPGATVAADRSDPSPELLMRFADEPVPVKPIAACRRVTDKWHGVLDRETGRPALEVLIGPVQRISPCRVRVRAQYTQGGLWGRGWSCEVNRQRDHDTWRVAKCRGTWVALSAPVMHGTAHAWTDRARNAG